MPRSRTHALTHSLTRSITHTAVLPLSLAHSLPPSLPPSLQDCVLGYPGMDSKDNCLAKVGKRVWMTTWDNFNLIKFRDLVGFFIDSVTIIVGTDSPPAPSSLVSPSSLCIRECGCQPGTTSTTEGGMVPCLPLDHGSVTWWASSCKPVIPSYQPALKRKP
jgi:hypothetical protein